MTEGEIKESILESKIIKGYVIEPKEIKQKKKDCSWKEWEDHRITTCGQNC